MRKLLVSVAIATATVSLATPATAQHHDRGGWNQRGPDHRAVGQLLRELADVDQRVERSARRGIVSPREANGLRRESNRIRNRLHRSGRNGLSGREYAQLRVDVNRLRQHLRVERQDRDRRRG